MLSIKEAAIKSAQLKNELDEIEADYDMVFVLDPNEIHMLPSTLIKLRDEVNKEIQIKSIDCDKYPYNVWIGLEDEGIKCFALLTAEQKTQWEMDNEFGVKLEGDNHKR